MLRLQRVIRLTGFFALAFVVIYLHTNPLLTIERLERDAEDLQPPPDMWWLKESKPFMKRIQSCRPVFVGSYWRYLPPVKRVDPINVSPADGAEISEDELIADFQGDGSKKDGAAPLKQVEPSPEAVSARRTDGVCSKGDFELDPEELQAELIEFLRFYQRPQNASIKAYVANQFAIWYMARQIRPKYILEVGPWNNFGTRILHDAYPSAQMILVDKGKRRPITYVDWEKNALMERTSDSSRTDFAAIEWSKHLDPRKTLVYFYDGVTHHERVAAAKAAGFRHLMFSNNTNKESASYFSMKRACDVLVQGAHLNMTAMQYPDKKTHKPRPVMRQDLAEELAMWVDVDVYFQFPSLCEQHKPNLRSLIPRIDEFLPATAKENQKYENICYVRLKKDG